MTDRTLELTKFVGRLAERDGINSTPIPSFYLNRAKVTITPPRKLTMALICVIVQGTENVHLGAKSFCCQPGSYLLVAQDLPLVRQLIPLDAQAPFLGLSLEIDFHMLASLIRETNLPPRPEGKRLGMEVESLNEDVLDAFLRLTKLIEAPEQIVVMSPLIRREIFYKLLLSSAGDLLQRMTVTHGNVQRVATGMEWIRDNATKTLRMKHLATHMGMSLSTMYPWFRSVTSMTPLQFQKHLRLQKARHLMISDHLDAGIAARRVGYSSPAQFSREYRRMFGASPVQDMRAIRASFGTPRTLQ